jgi:hypothetical protein
MNHGGRKRLPLRGDLHIFAISRQGSCRMVDTMRAYVVKLVHFAVLMGSLAWTLPAWADIPVRPERPADWNEHPEPMPAPPPEKEELAYRLLAATTWVLGSAALLRWRRARPTTRVEQAR